MVDLSDPGIRRACKYGRIVLNLMDVREVEGVVRLRDAALMLKRPRVSYSVLRVACAAMGLSHRPVAHGAGSGNPGASGQHPDMGGDQGCGGDGQGGQAARATLAGRGAEYGLRGAPKGVGTRGFVRPAGASGREKAS